MSLIRRLVSVYFLHLSLVTNDAGTNTLDLYWPFTYSVALIFCLSTLFHEQVIAEYFDFRRTWRELRLVLVLIGLSVLSLGNLPNTQTLA